MRRAILISLACILAGFAAGWFLRIPLERRSADELRFANELQVAADCGLALRALDRGDAAAAVRTLDNRLAAAVDRAYTYSRDRDRILANGSPGLSDALNRAAERAQQSGRVATAARARALADKLTSR